MKTPDEIKEGLACHGFELCDKRCPYGDMHGTGYDCSSQLCGDALILYERLEAENAELLEKVEQLETKCHQLERERDAAVADMVTIVYNCADNVCQFCKHKDEHKCAQICGFAFKGFEWRGVKEE